MDKKKTIILLSAVSVLLVGIFCVFLLTDNDHNSKESSSDDMLSSTSIRNISENEPSLEEELSSVTTVTGNASSEESTTVDTTITTTPYSTMDTTMAPSPATTAETTTASSPTTIGMTSTSKPTTSTKLTTPAPTTTQAPTTTLKYVVSQDSEKIAGSTENFKYGITKTKYTIRYYNVYSDNSKEYYDEYSYYTYDHSGYNATNDDLKDECIENTTKYYSYYEEILKLVNDIRAEAGVEPLVLDVSLCQAASMRAMELNYADYFSHSRPDGSSCFTVLNYFNISRTTSGENIAAGQVTPTEVVEGWKNSPGHYANMINPSFTSLGVGYMGNNSGSSYEHYWVQMFIG